MKFRNLPLDLIYKKNNVRAEAETELAELEESIDRYDVLQPILVRPVGDQYEIIFGHRRYLAAKMHGDETIPAVIRDDLDPRDRVYIQLVENTHRKQMSAAELTAAFDRLKEETPGLTNAKIAERIGRTAGWVSNQYVAARMAEKITDENVRDLTAGQIFARARKYGTYGDFKKNRKVKISFKGNTVKVLCNGAEIRDMVLRILDRNFPDE